MSDRFTYTQQTDGNLAAVRTFNPALADENVIVRLYAALADVSPDTDANSDFQTVGWAQLRLTANDARQLAGDLMEAVKDAEVSQVMAVTS